MIEPIVLRGIACPFNVAAIVENGVTELIEPGAFRDQVENELDCSVKLDSHDRSAQDVAHVFDGTLLLFESEAGLCFECTILSDIENFGSLAWEIHNRKYDRASINFRMREVEIGDDGIERVTQAQIDHVAVTADAAFGGWTGVWDANTVPENMTARLYNMNERWQAGYRQHQNNKQASQLAVRPAMAARSRVVMSGDIAAAEQRLAELLKDDNTPSAKLLRTTTLERLGRK